MLLFWVVVSGFSVVVVVFLEAAVFCAARQSSLVLTSSHLSLVTSHSTTLEHSLFFGSLIRNMFEAAVLNRIGKYVLCAHAGGTGTFYLGFNFGYVGCLVFEYFNG